MELKVITPTWDVDGTYFIVDAETAREKTTPGQDAEEGEYSYCSDEDLTREILDQYEAMNGELPEMATTESFAIATFSDCWYKAEITLF